MGIAWGFREYADCDSVDVGQGLTFALLASSQAMLVLLISEPHVE